MIYKINARRQYRKQVAKAIRAGNAELRVVGSEKDGFCLVAHFDRGSKKPAKVVPLYQERSFTKQGEAIAFGVEKFGAKARKLLLKAS